MTQLGYSVGAPMDRRCYIMRTNVIEHTFFFRDGSINDAANGHFAAGLLKEKHLVTVAPLVSFDHYCISHSL